MKKQQHGDIKSNLNTSCASDLYSSVLSSVYQFNIGESLVKINELKQLYMETCQEQVGLKRENQELGVMLQRVKRELNTLIQNNFSNQKSNSRSQLNRNYEQKQYSKPPKPANNTIKQLKPGSIAKINKQNIITSSNIAKHVHQDQVLASDPIYYFDEPNNNMYPNSSNNNSNNQSTLNIISAKTSRIVIGPNVSHKKSASNLTKPQNYYPENILKSQKTKKNIQYVGHRQPVNSIQSTSPHFTISSNFQDQQSQTLTRNKKTYLASPRNHVLHSPRNIFMA